MTAGFCSESENPSVLLFESPFWENLLCFSYNFHISAASLTMSRCQSANLADGEIDGWYDGRMIKRKEVRGEGDAKGKDEREHEGHGEWGCEGQGHEGVRCKQMSVWGWKTRVVCWWETEVLRCVGREREVLGCEGLRFWDVSENERSGKVKA